MAITTLTSGENGANSLIDVNANFVDLDTTKADLASPTFTGTPTLPTGTIGVTQTAQNNSTKLATTAYVDAQTSALTIETGTSTTQALTTTAGQKVIVIAKGSIHIAPVGTRAGTVLLNYNGVQKDVSNFAGDTDSYMADFPFCLQYTETPGVATQNITITSSTGTIQNVIIIVMKIG